MGFCGRTEAEGAGRKAEKSRELKREVRTMLNTVLLAAILLLEAVEAAIMAVAGREHAKRWAGAEAKTETETEELRLRENRMDEGFENLMRFSVGGKDGLGGTGDE